MNILITTHTGGIRDVYFPSFVVERFKTLGNVRFNETDKPFTQQELKEEAAWADICVTHWGSPAFTADVLDNCPNLKLIAHAAGSVANLCIDAVFERGIKVVSANDLLAKHVAEGALAYLLSALRILPQTDARMKRGELWPKENKNLNTLFGQKISFIGLGATGRYLLDLLKPFGITALIYDPYITQDKLAGYEEASLCSLDEALTASGIISVHASLTPETKHMLGANELKKIRDGALIINTARGAVFDEQALVSELVSRRLNAVLDVFEVEPLPLDSPLRKLENVILMPHNAGETAKEQMTVLITEEIEKFIQGQPLKHEISQERYSIMTRTT